MELRLDIGIDEIISLIRQLPMHKKVILKKELEKEITSTRFSDGDLTTLLINGPVMSKEEFEEYKSTHRYLGEWTKKLFA